ncbi:hypothetical protein BH23GEM9_BH23GEM9_02230 [soil metagenome]
MKRSLMVVVTAASVAMLGACGGGDTDADIEPVQEVQQAPPPPPVPLPGDTLMHGDTLLHSDTLPAAGTTGQ